MAVERVIRTGLGGVELKDNAPNPALDELAARGMVEDAARKDP